MASINGAKTEGRVETPGDDFVVAVSQKSRILAEMQPEELAVYRGSQMATGVIELEIFPPAHERKVGGAIAGIEVELSLEPVFTCRFHVRALLFAGMRRLF